MSLSPFESFRNLNQMRRELDRFFTTDFPVLKNTFGHSFGNLNVDVHETEHEVVAICDIPGLEKKEDVSIEIDNNVLSISGSINRTYEVQDEHVHRQERYSGNFQRSIGLPAIVKPEGVKATYKNGVLEVRMPKVKSDSRKRIDIDFD
ncbi:Hsp20/alpha crystallin family protein [Paenibacillus aestuarii]|uniref:Hsp20/alpha crystallin family protein n=1 Tax=Paenibacillus aestuarii TaxID=516965 RepID=A0ABW0K6E5_9BACL|nr:Hsp20/alpha crystallin family protein [Paenibacillus aestuarii]